MTSSKSRYMIGFLRRLKPSLAGLKIVLNYVYSFFTFSMCIFLFQIHISGASTKLSRFLQEEFSSQLINALRRQTVGHRFHNLAHALENEGTFPPVAILEKGDRIEFFFFYCRIVLGIHFNLFRNHIHRNAITLYGWLNNIPGD